MIKFHPSSEQIKEFVEGTLSPATSLMVSAHCDMCEKCQKQVELQTELLAAEMVSSFERQSASSSHFDSMLAEITQMPSSIESDGFLSTSQNDAFDGGSKVYGSTTIELDGRSFKLPRTLHRYIDKTGNWSSLVGKLWQAPVDLGNQGVANFIYMAQGGSVPEHTHRGTEYTLVIDGEFSDGLSHYDTGDFIFMDGEKTHTPKADTKEGCLVFSIVDQPLHFTSGLARLLNPFSHLFFR
jgi:putative transcriptional regulator